ncbi:MAG: flavin reductase [Fimbriimonadaceae bacterium]|nr:flavin reductase [Alphaproteobacteria bacterium]
MSEQKAKLKIKPDKGDLDEIQIGFREAMSRLGAAVHVITTNGTDGRCGFTASSVCSVTDEPPTVLVCLNRSSSVHQMFKDNGIFCINTLAAGHEHISNMFAGFTGVAMADRFNAGEWFTLATGAPAMADALVSIDCRISSIAEVGTHSVMFGEVQAIHFGEDSEALMYLRRSYHRL